MISPLLTINHPGKSEINIRFEVAQKGRLINFLGDE